MYRRVIKMDKFKINIEYFTNGTYYRTNLFDTEHFKIECTAHTDRIKLTLVPLGTAISKIKFKMTVPYAFTSDNRVFVNGYQSWTDCREYFIDENPPRLKLHRELLLSNTVQGAPGDYHFKKYDPRAGVFHGYSYAYVRNGENYDLFGSVSERQGYTIITAVCPENEIVFEKELEGVTIDSDYTIMDVAHFNGTMDEVFDKYFAAMKIAPPKIKRANGYTTWYNYYPNINEDIVNADLEALSKIDANIDFFQIDDGYQTAVGDWLSVNPKKFPHGMKYVADQIHAKGMKAGLWLAPLGAQYGSAIAKNHPEWLIRNTHGKPVKAGLNWGGFYALDIEVEEVRNYIRNFFDVVLNDWGYDMVKLDFLYAACVVPNHGKSRGQLMCEAMDFIRECVGDKLILGCGVPLAPAFGKVDYCRIGADMDLRWTKELKFHREDVSTPNTLGNTIFRRGLDGRAFCNDPDVFLLRDNNMHCTREQRKTISTVNHIFGSLLFTSDNVGDYDDQQMNMLLHVFNHGQPEVLSAEFVTIDVVEIKYVEDGEEKRLCFNIKNGEVY